MSSKMGDIFFMFDYNKYESEVLSEIKVLTPTTFEDHRGEMWTNWDDDMPMGNLRISKFTRSRKNVLRGLHGDKVTWKHISCISGAFYLVVVDYREDSVNYKKWDSFTLTDRNHKSVIVPPGFLNGHLCLSDECIFHYTQSYPEEYVEWQDQMTVKWDEPELQIDWPLTVKSPILSARDKVEGENK
jgi:dTDP-4-dehydrorhamnose 3,5-epimerase